MSRVAAEGGTASPLRAHVATRNAGFIACLAGVLVMISGRYVPGAPFWLAYAGLSGIVFGWGLLGLSMFRRAAEARRAALDAKS